MNIIHIAGVDEAGRGPLAGAVIAAAVILNSEDHIDGLNDSKKISEKKREKLFVEIQQRAISYGIGRAEVEEIDQLNILQATLLAMRRAVDNLKILPAKILVDGIHAPVWNYVTETIIQGDAKIAAISAASILAKVTRDREMVLLDKEYPEYGFAQHKAYGTAAHLAAIKRHGPCAIHRKSFAPVKDWVG